MDRRDPPDEAYGRVTNPERYRVLHEVADDLIVDLARTFDVQVEEDADDAELARRFPPHRIVRLAPATPAAAPIVFSLTTFPGVHVRFGRWWIQSYPSCGCDACDDPPAQVASDLRRDVAAVTGGGLVEGFDGRHLTYALEWDGGTRGGGIAVGGEVARPSGPRRSHRWAAWERRR